MTKFEEVYAINVSGKTEKKGIKNCPETIMVPGNFKSLLT